MNNRANRFPVDGSSALRVDVDRDSETRIIDFPSSYRRPRHAREEELVSDEHASATFGHPLIRRAMDSEMVDLLRHGTCAGKPMNKVTPLQAAGICLFFFFSMLSTLLFV